MLNYSFGLFPPASRSSTGWLMRFVRGQNTAFGQKAHHLAKKNFGRTGDSHSTNDLGILLSLASSRMIRRFFCPRHLGRNCESRHPVLSSSSPRCGAPSAFPIFPIGLASAFGKRAPLCRTPDELANSSLASRGSRAMWTSDNRGRRVIHR